jgi:hypothetical protein
LSVQQRGRRLWIKSSYRSEVHSTTLDLHLALEQS